MLVDFLSIFFIIEYRHRQPALPGRQGLLIAYQNIHLLTLDNLLCLKTKKKQVLTIMTEKKKKIREKQTIHHTVKVKKYVVHAKCKGRHTH